MTLIVLSSSGQIFSRMSLNSGTSNIFLIIRLRLWDFGKDTIEVKCLFHHIIVENI